MRCIVSIAFGGFAAFILAIIYLKNNSMAPRFFGFFAALSYHDKIGHFVLMGILSFLTVTVFSSRKRREPQLGASLRILLFLCLLITLEEFPQIFVESRTFSLSDLFFSLAGALLLGLLGHAVIRRFAATEPTP